MSSGGRRKGSGRKKGPSFRPATAAYRADAVQKMQTILDSADDPLSVVAAMVVDPGLDITTRLSAAHTCLPYLYPRSLLQNSYRCVNLMVSEAQVGLG